MTDETISRGDMIQGLSLVTALPRSWIDQAFAQDESALRAAFMAADDISDRNGTSLNVGFSAALVTGLTALFAPVASLAPLTVACGAFYKFRQGRRAIGALCNDITARAAQQPK